MPNFDPATPSPWLASLRASRRRRAEAAQSARRKRAGRGGASALLAAMTLIAGAAVAADGPGGTVPAAGHRWQPRSGRVPAAAPSSPSSARSACRPTACSAR